MPAAEVDDGPYMNQPRQKKGVGKIVRLPFFFALETRS